MNLAESWVGLRLGGERYQQAFYVFEELAQAPSTSTVQTLVAQAVSELHLGRAEEAQAALDQAMKKDPEYAEAIANALVLQVVIGKNGNELTEYVIIVELCPHPPTRLFYCFLLGISTGSNHDFWVQVSEEGSPTTPIPDRPEREEQSVRHRSIEIQRQSLGLDWACRAWFGVGDRQLKRNNRLHEICNQSTSVGDLETVTQMHSATTSETYSLP